MDDFIEILIYLIIFGVVTFINISKEKHKKMVQEPNEPETEDPTTPFPLPDIVEKVRRRKAEAYQPLPAEEKIRETPKPQPKDKVNVSPSLSLTEVADNQERKKIDLRKAILYSEIIKRKYE